MIGRPSIYTDDLAASICARLMAGESLRSIVKDEDMPASSTVFLWLATNVDFSERYAKAREIQAEMLADEIVEIADDGSNDWMQRNQGDNPGYAANGEAVARSRLRVDARKWVASKLLPSRYGDRLEHSGKVGLTVVIGSGDAELL